MDRREFLVKAGLVAGGVVLTVSSLGSAAGAMTFEDVTVAVGSDSPLAKVGGFQIVDSSAGKIIVIHETDTRYVAYSAKCTHRGALVEYDVATKQVFCPKHGSRFDAETGAVAKGPADSPLTSYSASSADAKVTVKVS
jgi:nitrite reductase/ring-hydroxylating ferredoxin subunit